ncbi:MAG: hypothetical protein H6983_14120 [Ectothiorhodospiraceae bacterium]|nr:hypothetical protein [Ectothiorhodospiraceae bacterium]
MADRSPADDAAGDRLGLDVACLWLPNAPLTLISTAGHHCEVWRSVGRLVRTGASDGIDIVLKRHREPCTLEQARCYGRDYLELRAALGDIVPPARFVVTEVQGEASVVVLARTCVPWFDLARPGNAEEAVPMLARMPRARAQLRHFVDTARAWRDARDARVIDLFGVANLVLDTTHSVRYLDSFGVFFYPDLLHAVAEPDPALVHRIEVSLARLDYLAELCSEVG